MDDGRDSVGARRMAVSLLALVLACLAVAWVSGPHSVPPAAVTDALAGGGVEIGSVGHLSVRSVGDTFVVLSGDVGVEVPPCLAPTLCTVLDSPRMLAELHEALSHRTASSLAASYTIEGVGGFVSVHAGTGEATVLVRCGRRVTAVSADPAELGRLSDLLAAFIIRHGSRTPPVS